MQDVPAETVESISRDVGRTFPNIQRFADGEGKDTLLRVLKAYAAYDPEIGYCQGMNFLAGLLLLYLDTEEHAFGALVVLMEDRGLRELYNHEMSLLQASGVLTRGSVQHKTTTGSIGSILTKIDDACGPKKPTNAIYSGGCCLLCNMSFCFAAAGVLPCDAFFGLWSNFLILCRELSCIPYIP